MSAADSWRSYVIQPDASNRDLLARWGWMLKEPYELLFYNLFGDVFLAAADGRLLVLDIGFGELVDTEQPAARIEQLLTDDDIREEWLQCGLVDELKQHGKRLRKRECYGFSERPPVLGGDYEPDNLEPVDLDVLHTLLSQIHEQIHDLPEGTEIDGIEIVEDDDE